MKKIENAIQHLDRKMSEKDQGALIPFTEYLSMITTAPEAMIRNVFQVFYHMIKTYVGEGLDEYPDDPESIQFVYYDCCELFVKDSDHPFFADRLFANRLVNLVESLKRGAQQNKVYIFEGPPGCGKSTFLNNLLRKFEEYANLEEGRRFEAVWRLDRKLLGGFAENEALPLVEKLTQLLERHRDDAIGEPDDLPVAEINGDYIEVPCPSHDNPLLMIPKSLRRAFFDDLFKNNEFKFKISTEKEYEWLFREQPCTICSSLSEALLTRLKSPKKVFEMLHVRPYRFNRRLGDGISVFNPGDKPLRQNVLTNTLLQRRLNSVMRDSNQVKYIFSQYAKTHNGIYALMDIKSHNAERFIELHNIISEGVHKVEDVEENVNSLFLAVMNPEDKKNIQSFQSFSDRIEYIKIPYVMDLQTEVEIYRNIFGKHIDAHFLPRVLHNFARVIIASRLKVKSEPMLEWIKDPKKYRLYCDENLQLLKMEIYTGHIPAWLTEEDRNRLTAKRRRSIISESEKEGERGFSGRDSIKIFNEFFSAFAKEDKLISMSDLNKFFTQTKSELSRSIPENFLKSLVNHYNYTILQEVKESLYYYNEEQIARDIKNYLFAINFESGAQETSTYTGEKIEITDDFFKTIEMHFLGNGVSEDKRRAFRKNTQKDYTSMTLPQEIMLEGKDVTETKLYESLHERYVHNLKEKVLDPFLENENFRRAIKDYNEEAFKTYDKKIKGDVTFLMNNLISNYRYTELGAKEVCIYAIDNDLARHYTKN